MSCVEQPWASKSSTSRSRWEGGSIRTWLSGWNWKLPGLSAAKRCSLYRRSTVPFGCPSRSRNSNDRRGMPSSTKSRTYPSGSARESASWSVSTHGIRNEKLASERRSKEHVASTYRQDEGRKGEKRKKNIDRVWQKTVLHREQGGENRQRDPLDGRSQVEDELRRASAISSSDSQTQGLGKYG